MRNLQMAMLFMLYISLVKGQTNDKSCLSKWIVSNNSISYTSQGGKTDTSVKMKGDSCFTINNDLEVYLKPEIKGCFSTDNSALQEYIKKNLDFQEYNKVSITVLVGFIIKNDGTLEYIGIRRGVDDYYDQAAFKLVNNMPSWIPAQNKGKNVASFYLLPINFQIK